MKYEIEKETAENIFEDIKELEDLLTDRISDFHEIKGMMQARYAYIFYRKLLWDIKYKLNESLKDVKPNKK